MGSSWSIIPGVVPHTQDWDVFFSNPGLLEWEMQLFRNYLTVSCVCNMLIILLPSSSILLPPPKSLTPSALSLSYITDFHC